MPKKYFRKLLTRFQYDGGVILPTNDGHPVKRVHYATEVTYDKTSNEKDIPESVSTGIQG